MLLISVVRLYSNVEECFCTHLLVIIHASLYFVSRVYLALGISTGRTDVTPLLIDEQVTAVGTLPGQVLDRIYSVTATLAL